MSLSGVTYSETVAPLFWGSGDWRSKVWELCRPKLGWCKSEFDRSLFVVFHSFLWWKTAESRSQLLETPTRCPQITHWHLEVPRQLNHAFHEFCQFWLRNHRKAVRAASDPASGNGNSFTCTEIWGQVTRLRIFFSVAWISFDLWSSLQPKTIQAL